jgi:Dihaem cytochrome c
MQFRPEKTFRMFALGLLVLASVSVVRIADALAHGEKEHEGQKFTAGNPKWKEDCGACHLAYPPQMLPADSWRAIMAGLDRHFGSNAGLDAETADEITIFLVENADHRKHESLAKPLLRITDTHWFKSEHGEISARTWKNAGIKSRANCGACHTSVESGDYSERNVKIPGRQERS